MKKNSSGNFGIFQKMKTDIFSFYSRFRKIINFFLILFLCILLLFVLFKLTYNLHFYKNPKITIEPAQLYKTLKNNESETINFTVKSKSNLLCESSCRYEFIDRSTTEAIFSQKIKEKKDIINVTISGPNVGSGVLVYNLEVTCENKKSLFCPYDSLNESSKKSSFVVLSYDLTENEKTLKEEIRPNLLNLLDTLNQVNSKATQINLILENESEVFFNKNEIKSNFKTTNKNIQKIINNTNEYYLSWEDQKYTKISSKKLLEDNKKTDLYLEEIAEKTSEIILNQNLTQDLILRYSLNLNQINNISKNYDDELKLKNVVYKNVEITNFNSVEAFNSDSIKNKIVKLSSNFKSYDAIILTFNGYFIEKNKSLAFLSPNSTLKDIELIYIDSIMNFIGQKIKNIGVINNFSLLA